MNRLTFLFMAVPTLVSAQNYYDPSDNTIVIQPRVPIVQQTRTWDGTITTTGINQHTGQMWSNTIQPNGYTYGTTTNGQMYQDNIYQKPSDKIINNFMINGFQNLGAQIGGAVYDSTNGGE